MAVSARDLLIHSPKGGRSWQEWRRATRRQGVDVRRQEVGDKELAENRPYLAQTSVILARRRPTEKLSLS